MIICLGPVGSGKTLLLKSLKNSSNVDSTTTAVPTNGTDIINIKIEDTSYQIRELGGSMAPIWPKYFTNVNKIIYLVDASNLCQISAAGVLLYTVLVHPLLKNTPILLVLSKMDASYRQMRNEALLMLQMRRLQKEATQKITITEYSAITGEGKKDIINWITQKI
ncbi:ADP-ribosylation factor-like protein 16 isoform X1 [Diorhabda carinulata]|uniref:ADP-ribosylation factor-like protein 16 isoform X1 n=1 Tax=Diorhabda carinulata TaxID=1163345 RepID=UPI0025A194B2|nr:ADP-ribosylation factor-like protein 16 isoform X1 [Diorhabda carinulata]